MSKPIINGKKSVSEKPSPHIHDIFGNALEIPAQVQAELDSKSLVGRWVNATKLKEMGGYHKSGWRPFISETYKNDFKFGSDPDGVVRRGDCILAVKTKEEVERHQAYLHSRANLQKDSNKSRAEELRSAMKSSGLGSRVVEGWGDDE